MAYNKSPFKMGGKSPLMKELLGNQGNLPMHLQEAIKDSPAKQMYDESGTSTKKMKDLKSKDENGRPSYERAAEYQKRGWKHDETTLNPNVPGKGREMKDGKTVKSPAKKYGKSPAKKHGKSPAKKYGKSPAKKHGMSPLKQRNTDKNGDGKVNVNELIPEGLEQGKKLVQKGKKFITSLGKISVFRRKTDEEKAAKAAAKALKKKQKADAKALKEKNKNK